MGDAVVTMGVTLGLMPGGLERAVDQYRRFVEAGADLPPADPLAKPYGGLILGGDDFVREVLKEVRGERLARPKLRVAEP